MPLRPTVPPAQGPCDPTLGNLGESLRPSVSLNTSTSSLAPPPASSPFPSSSTNPGEINPVAGKPGDSVRAPVLLAHALPQYSEKPEYLSPVHCRLCLQTYELGQEEAHLSKCCGLSKREYRRLVLRKTLAEWPQRISAQILRTRLAAFKQELCDYKFAQNPCASCCRLKRRCKLFDVVFPPADAQRPPEWLPWTEEEWLKHRKQWYESVDDILNINQYLERFFHVSGRLSAARMAVATFENDTGASPSFPSLAAAESWERRVQQWCENLRRDLHL